ncbi:MAG TPA: cytochrome P450 [Acetobacteraceae bacterium]|nr:cytochrome P450 [Acetobacteraceae bacterium]
MAERIRRHFATMLARTVGQRPDHFNHRQKTDAPLDPTVEESNARSVHEHRLPPGPAGDFVGVEDLFGWMVRNAGQFGDIFKASVFGSNVFVVSNPEYCERILRWNWRNYARKGQIVQRIALLLGNGLIASNGEFWVRQRRMIQPAFSTHSIAGLIDMITRANADLLDTWTRAAQQQETINVTHDLSTMVLKVTLTAIFGDDYQVVAPHFRLLTDVSARNFQLAQALQPASQIVRQVVERRRRLDTSAGGFLYTMMQGRDRDSGEQMSDAQLVREVMTLVVAGHETTAGLLNWIWYLLSRHPNVHTRLLRELQELPWGDAPTMEALPKYAYTRRLIDEALRLYPPLWLMTRKAVQDDFLGEYFVPAGTEIYISPYLIQHSPQLWEAPEQFDPDRMDPARTGDRHALALCPFGAGPRTCIGERLARVEVQLHLMHVAGKLRLRHDSDRPAEMTTGLNLLSKEDFVMRPEKLSYHA